MIEIFFDDYTDNRLLASRQLTIEKLWLGLFKIQFRKLAKLEETTTWQIHGISFISASISF